MMKSKNDKILEEIHRRGYTDPQNNNYVWMPEMEFVSPEEALERRKLWSDSIPSLSEMTIFAVNGAGDMFAWDNEDTVWFIEHDTREKEWFASNLSGALFRRIIEFASGEYIFGFCKDDKKDDNLISETEAVDILKGYLYAFGSCFDESRKEILNSLIDAGFNEYGELISYEQSCKIISDMERHINT